MPTERKPARLKQWRGAWYIFYTDFTCDPPKERRVSCGDRGRDARREMLQTYTKDEKREEVAADARGGGAAYETLLIAALDSYLAHCDERVRAREANPNARAEGMSAQSRRILGLTVERFKLWLTDTGRARLTTGSVTGATVEAYRIHYASGSRARATIAAEVRNLRCAFRWLDRQRPPLFRDFYGTIAPDLKPGGGGDLKGIAFNPDELTTFLKTALERESPDFQSNVKRIKRGRVENFKQAPAKSSGTPASRLFILLALTGMRLGEALQLKWKDVDLERGRITIHAQKTGATRILPLIGAPEGDVAPLLLELLQHWNMTKGEREFVLPHDGMDRPAYPKSAWKLIVKDAESAISGPQKLRKNFTSYAASLGLPSAVVALWQGHSPEVATRYYRLQVLDRMKAPDLCGAMGLSKLIEPMIPKGLRKARRA